MEQQRREPTHMRQMTYQHDRLLRNFHLGLSNRGIILRQQAGNMLNVDCGNQSLGEDFGGLLRSQNAGMKYR